MKYNSTAYIKTAAHSVFNRIVNSICSVSINTAEVLGLRFNKLDIKSAECFPFEKNQNHIFKDILCVHWKASNLAVNIELGPYQLYYLCYENMFKYYFRLRNMESNY